MLMKCTYYQVKAHSHAHEIKQKKARYFWRNLAIAHMHSFGVCDIYATT